MRWIEKKTERERLRWEEYSGIQRRETERETEKDREKDKVREEDKYRERRHR